MSSVTSPMTGLDMLPSEINRGLHYMVEEYKQYFTLQLVNLFPEYKELQHIITGENGVVELIACLKGPEYNDLKIFDDNSDKSDRQISGPDLIEYIENGNKQYVNLISQKLNIMNTEMDYDNKVQGYIQLHKEILQAQLELDKFTNIRIE